MQIGHFHLVARTLRCQIFLHLSHLGDFLVVEHDYYVALRQTGFCTGSALVYLSHIHSVDGAQVHFLALALLSVYVGVGILTLYAEDGALHGSVFLQVVYYLVHDARGDGKTITAVRTGLRIEHGVDAYQLARGVHQCTTAVAGIDGGIGLDERLHTVGIQRTGLGTYYAGGHSAVQVEGVADGYHPFAHTQLIAVADGKGGQVLTVYLDECQVGVLVVAYDAGTELTVVVQCHTQLIGALHHVVVGHYITI